MVRVGAYVNNRAAVFLGGEYTLSDLLAAARTAERLGFDFVSVGDSLVAKPRYSPIVTLGAIATVTDSIELTTGILQPHLRNPVMLAQEWATLDQLAGGRTTIGVGLGTGPKELVEQEYALVGVPKRRRGVAFDEAIRLLRRLWTEEAVTFHGEIFTLDDVRPGYQPLRDPHPPILVASGGYIPSQPGVGPNDFYSKERSDSFTGPFDRVARLGDGWITGIATPDEIRTTWSHIRDTATAYGRRLDEGFEVRLNCFINVSPDAAAARREGEEFLSRYHRLPFDEETLARWLIAGSPEQCAERMAAYVEAGVTSFQLVVASAAQERQLELVAGGVRPLLAEITSEPAGADA